MAQQVRRHGRVVDVQLKELQDENRRLKKMYAPTQLSANLLKEAMSKNGEAISTPGDGPKRDRGTFALSETCYRYQAKASEENARIADWLVQLTTAYRDWGFGLCFLHLRNVKGFGWNHKRVYRIYQEL